MKIGFFIQDEQLAAQFAAEKMHKEDEMQFYNEPAAVLEVLDKQTCDALVLSDACYDPGTFGDLAEGISVRNAGTKIAVVLSYHHDAGRSENMMKVCLSHGFFYVHPCHPIPSVVREVNSFIYGAGAVGTTERRRTVLFAGSTPNIGTTLVSFGSAVRLAQLTGQTIGYVCLNLKSSKIHRYLGIDEPQMTLDAYRAELKAQSLTKERLIQYSAKVKEVPGLYVLFGNMLREQAEIFTPEDVEYLLRLASTAFDLCIVEVNAYWDNAATICGALYADTRVIVTTKEIAHFQEDVNRWVKNVCGLFGMKESSFDVYIAQQDKSRQSGGFTSRDIRKETAMNVLGAMRYYPQAIEYLNRGRIVDLFADPSPLADDLTGLANTLIALYGLKRRVIQNRKMSLYKKVLSASKA